MISGPRQPDGVDVTLEPTQSVQNYMIQADSTEGSLQNDWLIMATKAAIQANQLDQAATGACDHTAKARRLLSVVATSQL